MAKGIKTGGTAIVGCGSIAPIHIGALLNSGIEISALCDIKKERAEELKERFSLKAEIFCDYDELLESIMPMSVHICTPHYLHSEQSIKALNRDINVLCEKPIAISEAEIQGIQQSAKRSKGIFGVCFQNRFLPSNQRVKSFAERKDYLDGYFAVPWLRDEAYFLNSDWRGKWETEGGGALINQAIHTLDLMLWFMGEPTNIQGSCFNFSHKNVIETEDTAICHFNFKNGGHAVFFATISAPETYSVQIKLQSGRESCYCENDVVHINGELVQEIITESYPGKICWGDGHKMLVKEFYNCLKSGRKFYIDEYEGAKATSLLLKIYESSKGDRQNGKG